MNKQKQENYKDNKQTKKTKQKITKEIKIAFIWIGLKWEYGPFNNKISMKHLL